MKIAVQAAVQEELEEILQLLSENQEVRQVTVFNAENEVAWLKGGAELFATAELRFVRKNGHGMANLGQFWKLLMYLRSSPDTVLVTGYPMTKHRILSYLSGRPHAAYIRGLMFDPSLLRGWGDRIFRLLKDRGGKFIDRFSCSSIYTVSPVNLRFLADRGSPIEHVTLGEPPWLRAAEHSSVEHSNAPEKLIVFTQAFASHGLFDEQETQLRALKRLATLAQGNHAPPLVLRIHPRDAYCYEEDPSFCDVGFDRTTPQEFLQGLSAKHHVVSPLSTLAFECLHLGYSVSFIEFDKSKPMYVQAYNRMGIQPSDLMNCDLRQLLSGARFAKSVFSECRTRWMLEKQICTQ